MSGAFDRKRLQEALPEGKPISRDGWKKLIQAAGSLRLSANAETNRQKLADYASALEQTAFRSEAQRDQAFYVLSCLRTLAASAAPPSP